MKNRAGNFTFKGNYTVREIDGIWYIYNRTTMTTTRKAGYTFAKARDFLLKNYDEVEE